MTKKQAKNKQNNRGLIVALSVFALFILLVSVFGTGLAPYMSKYIQCGGAPVVLTVSIEGSGHILYPGDENYGPSFGSKYYCNAPDVESVIRNGN